MSGIDSYCVTVVLSGVILVTMLECPYCEISIPCFFSSSRMSLSQKYSFLSPTSKEMEGAHPNRCLIKVLSLFLEDVEIDRKIEEIDRIINI